MVEKIEQYSSPDDHDKVSKVESHLDVRYFITLLFYSFSIVLTS